MEMIGSLVIARRQAYDVQEIDAPITGKNLLYLNPVTQRCFVVLGVFSLEVSRYLTAEFLPSGCFDILGVCLPLKCV